LDPGSEEGELQLASLRLLKGKPPKAMKIDLQNARADFSQGGYDVASAIDGKRPDKDNGWAISPKAGLSHVATFEFKEPLDLSKGGELQVVLEQNYNSKGHSLGKFRISITTSEAPIDFGVPQSIGTLLQIAADQRSDEQKETLLKFIREQDPEVAKKETALAEAKKPRPEDPKLKELESKLARTEKPLPPDAKLQELERAVKLSTEQLEKRRLTSAQDLAWALINNPAFLFNH